MPEEAPVMSAVPLEWEAVMSVSLSWFDEGEVDVGLANLVDGAGGRVQPGVQDDFGNLPLVVAGGLQRAEIVVANGALSTHEFCGKRDRGVGARIVGGAAAVGGDLRVIESDAVAGMEGVQRQTVLASD